MNRKYLAKLATASAVIALMPMFAAAANAQQAPTRVVAAETGSGAADDAAAVEADNADSGEILVTARRREERLLDVPIAISVMSSQTIEATGVKNLNQLAEFTPGLFLKPQGSGSVIDRSLSRLVFRGLSTSEGPVFIDGAPFAGSGAPDVTDVDRIEVLNGPQSVYFGRSTFSGAVNYVTKAPGNRFRGRISAQATTYNGFDGRVMLETPIIEDVLSIRVSGRRYSYGGQYKSGISKLPLGKQSTTSGSLSLAFTPMPNFSIKTYYSYQLDEDGPPEQAVLRAVGGAPNLRCALGGTGGPYWCGELPTLSQLNPTTFGGHVVMDPFTRSELVDNVRNTPVPFDLHWLDHFGLKRQIHHFHARIDTSTDSGWEFGLLGALSRTKLAKIATLEGLDPTGLVNPFHPATPALLATACANNSNSCYSPAELQLTTYQSNIVKDRSIEGRISTPQNKAIRATIGASFYHVEGPITANFGIQNSGRLTNAGGGGIQSSVNTPAVFGGVYFDITKSLTLSAEGRYQWDGITSQQLFPAVGPKLHQVFKSFSPRAILDYKITENSMVYATFSRGYRPGGFNPNLTVLTPAQLAEISASAGGAGLSFKQERLDNFEVGFKGAWLDNRLRLTAAAYYMQWRDGQIRNTVFFTQPNGSTGNVAATTNAGSVNLKGLELDANFTATPSLTLAGTFTYADNKLITFIYAPNGISIQNNSNVSGNRLDQTPKFSGSFSPTYRTAIADGWDFTARADFIYRGKYFVEPTNRVWVGARATVNGSLGFKHDNLKIDFFVRNLFDNDKLVGGSKSSESVYANNAPCTAANPICYNPNAATVISPGVSTLNLIFLALPEKRTFGMRVGFDF